MTLCHGIVFGLDRMSGEACNALLSCPLTQEVEMLFFHTFFGVRMAVVGIGKSMKNWNLFKA
jgi:hypothetical protein